MCRYVPIAVPSFASAGTGPAVRLGRERMQSAHDAMARCTPLRPHTLSRRRRVRAPTIKEGHMPPATRIVTGVDFVAVSTNDFEKARDFYANILGLDESKRWGSMSAQEFETGNLTIAVMESEAFGIEPATNTHPIEFHVDDFEAAKAELESRGVVFRGEPTDSGVCLQAFFQDPDGNALAIHHRYAPADGSPDV